jgi:hypothetical protein
MNKWLSKLFSKEVDKEDILTLIEEVRAEVSSITPVNTGDKERLNNVKLILDDAKLKAMEITRRLRLIEAQVEVATDD